MNVRLRLAVVAAAAALASSAGAFASSPLSAVSAAGDNTCVVYLGAAFCWGANSEGQVGNNSTAVTRSPAAVSGLGAGVTGIATSGAHTCAVVNGGAWCWGNNDYGQLGNNGSADSPVPVPVSGLASGVTAIAVGDLHTCAIANGGVKCWGGGGYGQLGNGATTFSAPTPVDVSGLGAGSGATVLASGRFHTCAIANGTTRCWGRGDSGEIGNGLQTYINTAPLAVQTFAGVVSNIPTAVEGGDSFTCGVKDGAAYCWGFGGGGQLGTGSANGSPSPLPVVGMASGVTGVSAGALHGCAVASGGAFCWGFNNAGQLGNPGSPGGSNAPVPVTGLGSGVQRIAAGGLHTCAIAAAGLYCWGSNLNGQLGDGGQANSNSALLVIPAAIATQLSATPSALAFGAQSMRTTSPAQSVTIRNNGGTTVTVTDALVTEGFDGTPDCATLAPGATCTLTLAFTPTLAGAIAGFAALDTNAGLVVVALSGIGERSLVTHYYRSILRRAPDAGGKAFWEGEATRVAGLGANVNETWFAMAQGFFGSAEYAAFARDNTGYVTDLYVTFFNRAPDAPGLAFWTSSLQQGMPREVALASFMFSPEFTNFAQAIFGNTAVRAEIDTVVDFYRGILSRLPDSGGFNFWRQIFRTAQCNGSGAVTTQADAISKSFLQGAEYAARNRTNAQYVGDLYNAFLRRGGDLQGVLFWVNAINGGGSSREQVRQAFVASPEFQARVQAVIAAGCQP